MIGGDYSHALEMSADNSWAGESSSRARQQVMNPEAHGTYQRPLHVFKYMHLHEYMKGKSQAYGGAAGVLGSGAVVRDTKRTLHIGASSDQDQEMKLSAGRERKKQHRRGGSKGERHKDKDHGECARLEDGEGGAGYFVPPEFINKGYYVWEAVRREWRGPADAAETARSARKIQREAEGAQLGSEEIEGQLTDPRHSKFSRKVPLNELIEVLDVLWQSEDTL